MAHIDLVALQQRLAQQHPKPATPVPAEPPSWSTRPAPASALRTTPASKARLAAASAAAPEGTLRATTTMRTALPLKATNARAERAEERARANALRAQIDELNAEMAMARAEADRALAEERQRAHRLSERVDTLQTEIRQAEARAEATNADRRAAEARVEAERARAEALRSTIDELKAGQARMTEMHARELVAAQLDAQAAQQVAAELRLAEREDGRKPRGRLRRVLAAWRGE
jgi:chromosome segregation ATPase